MNTNTDYLICDDCLRDPFTDEAMIEKVLTETLDLKQILNLYFDYCRLCGALIINFKIK